MLKPMGALYAMIIEINARSPPHKDIKEVGLSKVPVINPPIKVFAIVITNDSHIKSE
jgi:hypothetical protein